ncbi:MAG: sulfatase-like hydrolase/transferase, partial [bacterium]
SEPVRRWIPRALLGDPGLPSSRPRLWIPVLAGLLSGCSRPAPPAPPSDAVLLVTIDTLPASRVGCYGAPNVRTPEIDRLARAGLQVVDAISPAPLTLPSHSTMLTGLDPPDHGVRENGIFELDDRHATVAEQLPGDVRKAAFVGSFPLASRFNLDQGFDLYDDDFGPREDTRRPPERRAETVFQSAAAWLDGAGARPFAWVHAFDPHYPYAAPLPWRRVAETLAGAGPYEGEVAYVDRELGKLLRRVGAHDRARRATVLLTADHGESLGEHGEITHAIFIYDATQRVPLMLAGPGVEPRLETRPRRLADVAPTLLDRYGLGPSDANDGTPLLEAPPERPAYLETKHTELLRGWSPLHAVRTERWKYIRAPRPELYDLRDDPGERANLAGSQPEIESELERRLEEILAASVASPAADLDAGTAARLRSLGYVASVEVGSAPDLRKDPKDGVVSAAALFHGEQAYVDGRFRAAEHHLLRAIELDPERKDAHSFLAGTYCGLNRWDLAAEHAQRSLDLPPHLNEGPVHSTLGEALLALGEPAKALPHLKIALEERPESARLKKLVAEAQGR